MAKNKGGRPLKFQSVEDLQEKVDKYFDSTGWKTKKMYSKQVKDVVDVDYYVPALITGLAVALKVDRGTILNYGNREEFFSTIKEARAKCEANLEEGAVCGELAAAPSIFSLKNNHQWKDKTEQDINLKLPNPILDVLQDSSNKESNSTQEKD